MNIAIIFAGGTGQRMDTKDIPKQFLLIHGKPLIAHTIQRFQSHQDIDTIIVSCIHGWLDFLKDIKSLYNFNKVSQIVQGGDTGQLSIYNALKAAEKKFGIKNNIVLIHDAVRPLVSDRIISLNIEVVKKYKSCITCSPTKESVLFFDDKSIIIPDRSQEKTIKAPQTFYLKDILEIHNKAKKDNFILSADSASLANKYGFPLHIECFDFENIKITTQSDFYMLKGIFDSIESKQFN